MDKKTVSRILIDDAAGAIPVFLNIDDEPISFDIRKMLNVIFLGKERNKRIKNAVSTIKNVDIIDLNSDDDLNYLFNEVKERLQNIYIAVRPIVVTIYDMEKYN